MVRAAALRRPHRSRPARTVAALMLAMLVVQLAAQWCAWQCGALDALGRSPFASHGEAVARVAGDGVDARAGTAPVASAEAGPASSLAAADPDGDIAAAGCGADRWCDLGQTPPLAACARAVDACAPSAHGRAPPGPNPSFLLDPEERPPTA